MREKNVCMIVIGIGTGRSGTASLAKLLNAQRDAVCFHEMNPSCVRFHDTPRPILNTIEEYQAILDGGDPGMVTVDLGRRVAAEAYDRLRRMPTVRMIGDIAFYYLTYVDQILQRHPRVRFVSLQRDRTETVESWLKQAEIRRWRSKRIADLLAALITREPFHEAHNWWMEHDGSVWRPDPIWDKCFPKFPGPTARQAVEQYWDYYYETVDALAARHPDAIFRIRTETLNDPAQQARLLAFVGVPEPDMVFTDAHIHRLRTLETA
jgi:hypothetical protein